MTQTARPRFVVLPILTDKTTQHILQSDRSGVRLTPLLLARSLAANPFFGDGERATVVFRAEPAPRIAVLGYFAAAWETRLDALANQLVRTLERLRFVDHAQVEADCERLAGRLLDALGRNAIDQAQFAAIPRGGLIVLGALSYVLSLRQAQIVGIEEPMSRDRPLVVVDDVVITGARFRRFLERCDYDRVTLATLYAHPGALEAIVAQEARVEHGVNGHDTHDHAPALLGDDYDDWRRDALARSGTFRYWVGLPDHVCFPWNEPDVGLWNPVLDQEETGWRVLPPELCLNNRAHLRDRALPLQIQPVGKPPLQPAADVLFGRLGDEVIVASERTGVCYAFDGVAADIWSAIVAQGNVPGAVQALARAYDAPASVLESDVAGFVGELRALNLLTEDAAMG